MTSQSQKTHEDSTLMNMCLLKSHKSTFQRADLSSLMRGNWFKINYEPQRLLKKKLKKRHSNLCSLHSKSMEVFVTGITLAPFPEHQIQPLPAPHNTHHITHTHTHTHTPWRSTSKVREAYPSLRRCNHVQSLARRSTTHTLPPLSPRVKECHMSKVECSQTGWQRTGKTSAQLHLKPK